MLKNGRIQITMDPSHSQEKFRFKSGLPKWDWTVIKMLVDVRWLNYIGDRLRKLIDLNFYFEDTL